MNAVCDRHGFTCPARNPKSWRREAGIVETSSWFDLHPKTLSRAGHHAFAADRFVR
jgi:hypothetical protein